METKTFFTTDFYDNPQLTLAVFNSMYESPYLVEMDMYESGTFLFMDVSDIDGAREILSSVISDIDAYIDYNNKCFTHSENSVIGLKALHDEHREHFYRNNKEIKWDAENYCFIFQEDLI